MINPQTIDEIIEQISANYSALSPECKIDFKSCVQKSEYKKGYTLVREGQHSDRLFFIVTGSVKAYYRKNDKLITDWFAFEGDFICAINSYFLSIPSPHFIELTEDSSLLVVTRDEIIKLCDKHHDFERLSRIAITKTMLQLQQRIVSLQFETAQQKVENLLKAYPHIYNRVSLGDIASFLGITQETLSRVRAGKS